MTDRFFAWLLKLAMVVDGISVRLGRLASCAVLSAAVISAGNAFVRYGLDISSNGWLEIQWYLFTGAVMLGAPTVLGLNEHVRVDIVYGQFKGNGPVYVDLFGLLVFLLPVMGLLAWLTWSYFWNTFASAEMSGSIGGLIRWPAALLMPLGFGMMFLQGLAEIIKRLAHLSGARVMDTHYEKPLQ